MSREKGEAMKVTIKIVRELCGERERSVEATVVGETGDDVDALLVTARKVNALAVDLVEPKPADVK